MHSHDTHRRPSFARVLALTALALVLPLAGCGGGGSNGGSGGAGGTTTSSAPAPAPVLSASAVAPDGLTATLAEDRATVPAGGDVTYTLTLTNNTSQPITYQAEFGSASIGAGSATSVGGVLQIVDASGQTVFPVPGQGGTTSPAAVVPVSPVVLAPGQSTSGAAAVGGVFAAGGRYAATAQFILQPTPGGPTQSTTVGPLTVTVQ